MGATAGITLALAALVVLVALPLEPTPRTAPGEDGPRPRAVSSGHAPPPVLTLPAPATGLPRSSVQGRPSSRPGSVHFEPRERRSAPTPAPATGPVADALAEPEALARLRLVDLLLNDGKFDDALAVVEALLDRPLADPAEDELQRISLLTRLGYVPHSVAADRRLAAALAPDRPRAERLVAVDGLGRGLGLHPLWTQALEPLAESDKDVEVRRRARVALGRE